jgi:hypothetical protein
MQEYMFIYHGGDPEWHINTPAEEMQAAMGRWETWMADLSEKGKLVSGGSPLHYAGKRVTPSGEVTDIAASELKELVSGYSIVAADSIDEAVELSKTCPIMEHTDIVVEVREVLKTD